MLLANELHGAGGRSFQTSDDVQQRRLAAARRADDAKELAVAHIKINAADSANVALARRVHFSQSANHNLHVSNDRNCFCGARREGDESSRRTFMNPSNVQIHSYTFRATALFMAS